MQRRRLWTIVAAVAAPAALVLAGCAQQQPASDTSSGAASEAAAAAPAPSSSFGGDATVPEAVAKPLRVALVARTTQGGWLEDYKGAIQEEVTALGGTLQVFDAQNDLSKMASDIDTAVNSGVDALLLDNGTDDALHKSVQAALDKGIPVVTYDFALTNDGVAAINQDDAALATNGLEAIKSDFGGTANIVVISVAGYTPLDNRLAAVNSFVKENTGIRIVAQTGTVSNQAALDTEAQVEALLKANPDKGQIDAIWTHWNDFAVGAFNALKTQGRSDVKLYTVDLTDQDLPFFWDTSVDFEAASASNPETIGIAQVRLAYQKVAGDDVTDVTVQPVLVRKADLPATQISYGDLGQYVPGWTDDATVWPAWIQTLESQHQ